MSTYVDGGVLQLDILESDLKFALHQLKQRDNQKACTTVEFILEKLMDIREYDDCTAAMNAALSDYIGILEKVIHSLCSNLDLKPPIKVLKMLVKSLRKEVKRTSKGKSKPTKSKGSHDGWWGLFVLVVLGVIVTAFGGTVGDVFIAVGVLLFIAVFWKVILWVIAISIGVSAVNKLKR